MKLVAEVKPVADFPAGLRLVITENNVVRHDPYFGSGAGDSDLIWGPPGSRFVVSAHSCQAGRVLRGVQPSESAGSYARRPGSLQRTEPGASGRIEWGF